MPLHALAQTLRVAPVITSCRELVDATDWTRTVLGPHAGWPVSLRGYVSMVLEMPTPAIIFWGADLLQIYNDGYSAIMGPRHPRYFGAPYRECWPDTYPVIHPWMRAVLERGELVRVEDTLFTLTRHGFEEEAYFTFTFSPLRDDAGAIAGILQPVVEVTGAVLARRRAELTRRLAMRAPSTSGVAGAFEAIAGNAHDLPFAIFYRERAGHPELEAHAGVPAPVAPVPAVVEEVLANGAPQLTRDLGPWLAGGHAGPWPEPPGQAYVLRVQRMADAPVSGVLVCGLSPRLRFDDAYRELLEAVARELARLIEAEEAERSTRELLQREQAARAEADAERARLHAIFAQAPAAITILRGPEYVVELANPLMFRLWGRGVAQVLGRPLFEALPDIAGQGLEELLDGVRASGQPYVGTELPVNVARLAGGELEQVYFSFVYEPMRDAAGRVEGVMVVATDQSTQVRARQDAERLAAEVDVARDRAEAANRAKDEFLAMLGHELRNPLAPILTALELLRLRDDGSGAYARERAVIERQARHLARLVDDLLDVSRITRGMVELKREPVELAEVVAKAVETVAPLVARAQHRLVTDLPAQGLVVDGDPARLTQVFVNLLTNAVKYTDPGGAIRIAAARQDGTIVASVADSGRGIAPDMLERIFGLFEQEQQNVDRAAGGLGLGLAIVKSLVELHSGRVDAASPGRGQGSTFTVRLPAAPTATGVLTPSAAVAKARPAVRASQGPPRSVLVVDDNEDAALLLAEAVARLGFTVEVAHDGARALALAEAKRYDAALIDVGLPIIDGHELARRLRQLDGWRTSVLVAVTGYGQDGDRERSRAAGFDHHLVKPVDVSAVIEVLAS